MKLSHYRIVFAAIVALPLSLASCKRPIAEEEEEPAPPVAVATRPPATPTPPPVAAATPKPNYFAPPGVYFLIAGISVETPEGIAGVKAGTRLQKIGAGKYTADGRTLELRDQQVTNDLRIAQRIIGADQAAQAAIRRTIQQAEATRVETAAAATPKATPNTIVARGTSTAPAPSRPTTALGSSGAFNRTKTQDGWVWEMDSKGNWQPIRPNR